ncbi:hypothetical protein PROFUN_05679 [Planoprotostelium fungivorum]|uniref:Uncharacterized protein n=1 Tax=Planoprotostelium fungivorum TaxID=1890364 RepID=A0A2P6NQD2_9EUKA|nr:hypothetical protein PROFUN_05679 [Planoprotostelium fungivorum]
MDIFEHACIDFVTKDALKKRHLEPNHFMHNFSLSSTPTRGPTSVVLHTLIFLKGFIMRFQNTQEAVVRRKKMLVHRGTKSRVSSARSTQQHRIRVNTYAKEKKIHLFERISRLK